MAEEFLDNEAKICERTFKGIVGTGYLSLLTKVIKRIVNTSYIWNEYLEYK